MFEIRIEFQLGLPIYPRWSLAIGSRCVLFGGRNAATKDLSDVGCRSSCFRTWRGIRRNSRIQCSLWKLPPASLRINFVLHGGSFITPVRGWIARYITHHRRWDSRTGCQHGFPVGRLAWCDTSSSRTSCHSHVGYYWHIIVQSLFWKLSCCRDSRQRPSCNSSLLGGLCRNASIPAQSWSFKEQE